MERNFFALPYCSKFYYYEVAVANRIRNSLSDDPSDFNVDQDT